MNDSKKIMIVDDCEIALEAAKIHLEDAGFKVITRNNPLGTASAILSENPHSVLLDVSMPSLSGDSIVKLVKNNYEKDIKIILHSAKDEDELAALTEECGADGYIKKTGNGSDFIRQVNLMI